MFAQKYIKEITYTNFVNYPNILQKINFHFFLVWVKQYVYLCGMEQKIRITIEATILDKEVLEHMELVCSQMPKELEESGKVENVTFNLEKL